MENKLMVPIDSVHLWEQNPRDITAKDFLSLKNKIKRWGIWKPFLVWESKSQILGGNQRYKACKELGHEQIWVEYREPANDAEALEMAIADNESAGEWNKIKLSELAKMYEGEINIEDYKISLKSFSLGEIITREAEEDDFKDEDIKPFFTAPGDLYEINEHRILCGDSTSTDDLDKLMNGELGDLIYTDPPYSVNYKSKGGSSYDKGKYAHSGGIFNDDKTDEEAIEFYKDTLSNLYSHTKDGANIYWWFANGKNHINRIAWIETGWYMSQIINWLKESLVMAQGQDYHRIYEPCMHGWKKGNKHYKNKTFAKETDVFSLDKNDFAMMLDTWYVNRDKTSNYIHPTQKPVKLGEVALKMSSKEGETVLDLFGGSGSTLILCEELNRRARIMELDPFYVDAIVSRLLKRMQDTDTKFIFKKNNEVTKPDALIQAVESGKVGGKNNKK